MTVHRSADSGRPVRPRGARRRARRGARGGLAFGGPLALLGGLLALFVGVLPVPTLPGPAGAAAAGPLLPANDPFYRYTGSAPLAAVPPGTVLRSRGVTVAAGTSGTPLPATQLLYRTTDELGRPAVTVTTVLVPAAARVAPKIVAYLSFYDSLSGKCDPSYTLTGGDPGANNTQLTQIEQALVQQYYQLGWVTTVPDFEGTGLHWTAGHESGYGTLDAIRATEHFLHAPASTPVGLSGYSGGSIAGDWASELAPHYAPELTLAGVAEGGLPVDFAHNLTYVNGSAVWSGILPAVLDALARAYGIPLAHYLSPLGATLTARDATECIGDFSGTTPGLRIEQLLAPPYRAFLRQPVFVAVINKLIMGTVPGRPREPLLMEVGSDPANAQGQGDDIMVSADVQQLAYEYCGRGVPVEFHVLPHTTHEQAALAFEPQATAFLAARFAGAPFVSNCGTFGPGNSLAPLTVPASTGAATPVAPAGAPGRTPPGPAAVGATPRSGLAATGLPLWLPAASLLLLACAAGARRLRRRS